MDLVPIPSQTVGPFFHLGCTERHSCANLVGENTPGSRINLVFQVFDGAGTPVDDAMIEIWQADADGRLPQTSATPDLDFAGFGRMATDEAGAARFQTIRPGRVADTKGGQQAPHISVSVFARGLLQRLITRVYFAGDPANAEDSVLALAPSDRRATLFARETEGAPGEWKFDIRLSGEHETVFFDV